MQQRAAEVWVQKMLLLIVSYRLVFENTEAEQSRLMSVRSRPSITERFKDPPLKIGDFGDQRDRARHR